MAVGIIIGAAFIAILTSLVKGVIMLPFGLTLGKVDFSKPFAVLKKSATAAPYDSLTFAQASGAITINYVLFVNTIIIFLIISFFVFFPIARSTAKMQAKKVETPATTTTKEYPFCSNNLPFKATRWPNCTSPLTK